MDDCCGSQSNEDGRISDFSDAASDIVLDVVVVVVVVIMLVDDCFGWIVKALIELVRIVPAMSTPHNTADPNFIFAI